MKKIIVVLLVLCVCLCIFADDNKTWTYENEDDLKALYHLSADFIVSEADVIHYASEYDWDAQVVFAFVDGYDLLIINFENILSSEQVTDVVYAETLDGLITEGSFSVFTPTFSEGGSCILAEKDAEFFFNELAYYSKTGQGCFALIMKSGKLLFFTLNCENLYKYATYLE